MRIDILTVLPQLLESPFAASIMKRAQDKGHVEIHVHNIRDYSTDKHKNVDDYQYGGGAGMVMSIEPIAALIEKLTSERSYDDIIYMTPDGKVLDQNDCNQMSLCENIMILCGHYKGVDDRIRQHYITKEISIGSYVLSGGELAAAVVVDAVVRLIPGVLNDETSALTDSFKTIYSLHRCSHVHLNLRDGKCRMCCFQEIKRKLIAGGMNKRTSEPKNADPIC